MKNLICAFAVSATLMIAGCAVRFAECRPSASIDRVDKTPDGVISENTCQFNIQHPTACIGTLWLKLKCPTENL